LAVCGHLTAIVELTIAVPMFVAVSAARCPRSEDSSQFAVSFGIMLSESDFKTMLEIRVIRLAQRNIFNKSLSEIVKVSVKKAPLNLALEL